MFYTVFYITSQLLWLCGLKGCLSSWVGQREHLHFKVFLSSQEVVKQSFSIVFPWYNSCWNYWSDEVRALNHTQNYSIISALLLSSLCLLLFFSSLAFSVKLSGWLKTVNRVLTFYLVLLGCTQQTNRFHLTRSSVRDLMFMMWKFHSILTHYSVFHLHAFMR